MKLLHSNHIEYEKDDGPSKRHVIPITGPSTSYLTLDVTELDEDQRKLLITNAQNYNEYRSRVMSTMFSFEDWMDLTQQDKKTVKWRRFTESKITVL